MIPASAGYQGVDRRFRLGKFVRDDTGNDQCMMVRHFGAVHTPGIQVGQVKGFPVCLKSDMDVIFSSREGMIRMTSSGIWRLPVLG